MGKTEAGFCQQQCLYDESTLKPGYGGRADRGMKKTLRQGILTAELVPRAGRGRYPAKVSGLADEDICLDWNYLCKSDGIKYRRCYLGLRLNMC